MVTCSLRTFDPGDEDSRCRLCTGCRGFQPLAAQWPRRPAGELLVGYLDDVVHALRCKGIPINDGSTSAVCHKPAGQRFTIVMGNGPSGLAGTMLFWQPGIGWSLVSGRPRLRQWVLP